MSSTTNRIYEFDVLRVIAILLVMVSHLRYNVPIEYLKFINKDIAANVGLCIFFFIFGFLLYRYQCNDLKELLRFFKSKFIRLIPIFWFTLILQFIFLADLGMSPAPYYTNPPHVDSSIGVFIFNAMCLQFLSLTYSYPGTWFMGNIVFILIIYGITSFITKDRTTTLLILIILFVPLRLLQSSGLIGASAPFYLISVIGYICGVLYFTKNFKPILNNIPLWIKYCSYASYPVYLTNGLIYVLLVPLLIKVGLGNDIALAILGIPAAFIMGYAIQYCYDKILSIYRQISLSYKNTINQ